MYAREGHDNLDSSQGVASVIRPSFFFEQLQASGITFFAGVPDSLLEEFCSYAGEQVPKHHHVIAANEGGAVAIACGHYLASGEMALVYLQNSGLGNALNPLLSLADRDVYGLPLLLLVGWRGAPGLEEQPQHCKQGRVTIPLLEAAEIQYQVAETDEKKVAGQVRELVRIARQRSEPVALVMPKDAFSLNQPVPSPSTAYKMDRENALKLVLRCSRAGEDVIISTTGRISRELYELREREGAGHAADFLSIGSMGHASQIALGVALARPDRRVLCLDGDGAMIMHLGSLVVTGQEKPKNFRHIVFNNGMHESVGGQPTAGFSCSLADIAAAAGYIDTHLVTTEEGLSELLPVFCDKPGPSLLEIRIKPGARDDLGRPKNSPVELRDLFMKYLA